MYTPLAYASSVTPVVPIAMFSVVLNGIILSVLSVSSLSDEIAFTGTVPGLIVLVAIRGSLLQWNQSALSFQTASDLLPEIFPEDNLPVLVLLSSLYPPPQKT